MKGIKEGAQEKCKRFGKGIVRNATGINLTGMKIMSKETMRSSYCQSKNMWWSQREGYCDLLYKH